MEWNTLTNISLPMSHLKPNQDVGYQHLVERKKKHTHTHNKAMLFVFWKTHHVLCDNKIDMSEVHIRILKVSVQDSF